MLRKKVICIFLKFDGHSEKKKSSWFFLLCRCFSISVILSVIILMYSPLLCNDRSPMFATCSKVVWQKAYTVKNVGPQRVKVMLKWLSSNFDGFPIWYLYTRKRNIWNFRKCYRILTWIFRKIIWFQSYFF